MASMSAYVSRQTEGGTEGPLQLKECVQQREGPLQLKESVQQRRMYSAREGRRDPFN